MTLHRLTFILGGAASGKSRFAETLVLNATLRPVYLATAEAYDDEMRAKIATHRARRGTQWREVEAATDLCPALKNTAPGEVVLLDCATMWLSNTILAGDDPSVASAALLAALASCPAPVVVVSNETGQGIVPDTPLGRRFRQAQGELNQALAAQADRVTLIVAGLPLALKGGLA